MKEVKTQTMGKYVVISFSSMMSTPGNRFLTEMEKYKTYDEIKSHHYIVSFDPKDRDECGLTGEQAQQPGDAQS